MDAKRSYRWGYFILSSVIALVGTLLVLNFLTVQANSIPDSISDDDIQLLIEEALSKEEFDRVRWLAEVLPEEEREELLSILNSPKDYQPQTPLVNFIGINGASCSYDNFSDAMTAAISGDTLYINEGTYTTTIGTVNKDLTFLAAKNNCQDPGSGVTIDADDVDRLVWVQNYRNVTFTNLILSNGTAPSGGMGGNMYVTLGSYVVLQDTTIVSGSAYDRGGGVRIYYNSTVEMLGNSKIIDNRATGVNANGAGVAIYSGTLIMRGNSWVGSDLHSNISDNNGGGIYLDHNSYLEVTGNSKIMGNEAAQNGGGIYATDGSQVLFKDNASLGYTSYDQGNSAQNGGGIYLADTTTSLTMTKNNSILNNDASASGGGIYISGIANAKIDNALIKSNSAATSGGGIYIENSAIDLKNVIFYGNSAGDDGGGLAAYTSTITMQGYYPTPKTSPSPTERSSLSAIDICNTWSLPANNFCSEFRENTATDLGGAAYLQFSDAVISTTAFISNTAAWGVALEIWESSAELINSLLTGNDATDVNNSVVHVYRPPTSSVTTILNATHNTWAGNPADAIRYSLNTQGQFNNNVVWENDALGEVNPFATATCNDTQDEVLSGAGNISQDPQFATKARGDYHLGPNSPALDACLTGSARDLENFLRPIGSGYDMGAFEDRWPFQLFLPVILK